jgi:hypothetical protein
MNGRITADSAEDAKTVAGGPHVLSTNSFAVGDRQRNVSRFRATSQWT